jgi:hypothetical protein
MAGSDLDRGCCRSRMDQPHATGCAVGQADAEEADALIERQIIDLLDRFHDGQRERKAREIVQLILSPELSRLKADADLCAASWAKEIEHSNALRDVAKTADAARLKAEAALTTLAIWAHAVSDDASPNNDGALRLGGEVVVKASLVLRIREALAGLQR